MKHWSIDTTELQKNPESFAVWQLEQAVNFGVREGKISSEALRRYWPQLDLDPYKKKFLELLLST